MPEATSPRARRRRFATEEREDAAGGEGTGEGEAAPPELPAPLASTPSRAADRRRRLPAL
jgi:hypothetical protein